MPITAKNDGGSGFEPIAAGTYAARCYSMVHIGTVTEAYMGQMKEQNKVRLTWELPTELKEFKEGEGEKPYVVSKDYALSMYEKANLRKHLESWRGKKFTEDEAKAFDITKLLGKECLISIVHKPSKDGGKVYADITGISTLPKGMVCPPQINPTFEFSWENYDADKFESLPDWLKTKMKESKEYQELIVGFTPDQQNQMHGAEFEKSVISDDDLPF